VDEEDTDTKIYLYAGVMSDTDDRTCENFKDRIASEFVKIK
jgi:hypothetical protein